EKDGPRTVFFFAFKTSNAGLREADRRRGEERVGRSDEHPVRLAVGPDDFVRPDDPAALPDLAPDLVRVELRARIDRHAVEPRVREVRSGEVRTVELALVPLGADEFHVDDL